MEELIVIIIQFLAEVVFEAILYGLFDWPSKHRATPESDQRLFVYCLWCVAGAAIAFVFTQFVSQTLIALPALRFANLVLAPWVSAYLAKSIAEHRKLKNAAIRPKNHFWQAFWFTLSLVAVRFVCASHA